MPTDARWFQGNRGVRLNAGLAGVDEAHFNGNEMDVVIYCGMDRNMLLHDLAEVEQRIALGEAELADQQALIADLDHDDQDRSVAIDALAELREAQNLHERRRELILRALSTPASRRK